jgi:hypothetical protein
VLTKRAESQAEIKMEYMKKYEEVVSMDKTLKKITYKQFCDKIKKAFKARQANVTWINPKSVQALADLMGYKIQGLHNVLDDAKRDNRI